MLTECFDFYGHQKTQRKSVHLIKVHTEKMRWPLGDREAITPPLSQSAFTH